VAVERTRAVRRASSGIPGRWLNGMFVMKGWLTASLGLRRRLGSHRRRLAAWASPPAFAADSDSRFANRVEEELLASALLDQMLIGWAEDLHDAGQLFLFVLTREDGITSPKLRENATERPHIDAQAVAAAENDFRAAVETRLDVSVDLLLFATRAAKVDDSDVGLPGFTEQDVLRLEIAVNDVLLLQQD
jgi:hypothetical protein